MTDLEVTPTGPETKPASRAVALLCAQHVQQVQQMAEQLAAIALESDGLDPKDGWRLDLAAAQYVRVT